MADGKTEWPQDLKDFANRCFASANDSNRKRVSEELRQAIFDAYQGNRINSINWSQVQLKGLGGRGVDASLGIGGSGTSGLEGTVGASKSKKRMIMSSSGGNDDLDRKEKRARRFERDQAQFEQEKERGWTETLTSTSLASRLGGASLAHTPSSSFGSPSKKGSKRQKEGWTYDAMPTTSTLNTSSSFDRGGNGTPGFVDESIADPNVIDWDRDTVVGLSTKLEKPYLRLTSAPDPKTVRPLPILQQTLELLKKKWRQEQNYAYICDQFKSMRQDLTVQRIKNDFTVKVYEIHARIALEKGDLGEYNQCQSQLRMLYAFGLPGCQMEFLAYRILYLLHTQNRREVNALMTELTPASKTEAAVAHALSVRLALASGNYHRFFKLYGEAPNMNAYIMDHFVERERVVALTIMAKSYRPSLPLSYITQELAFEGNEEADAFLRTNNVAIYIEPTPAEAAAAAQHSTTSGRSKSKKSASSIAPQPIPLEARKWDCKNALPGMTAAAARYKKIDIKGQI